MSEYSECGFCFAKGAIARIKKMGNIAVCGKTSDPFSRGIIWFHSVPKDVEVERTKSGLITKKFHNKYSFGIGMGGIPDKCECRIRIGRGLHSKIKERDVTNSTD